MNQNRSFRVVTSWIEIDTPAGMSVNDVTPQVKKAIAASGLREGTVTCFVPGATGGFSTIEFEPGLAMDLEAFFARVAPDGIHYHHDERWHDGNGHSHIRATLLGPSLVVPFQDGTMTLGTWQQIVFVDFDVPARNRKLIVQVQGV